MEPKFFCQSCTMPIDNTEDRGTEKDGTKSELYCKYCYRQGEFINPGQTLQDMKTIVTEQMQQRHIPDAVIQQSMHMLPGLKRWKTPDKQQR